MRWRQPNPTPTVQEAEEEFRVSLTVRHISDGEYDMVVESIVKRIESMGYAVEVGVGQIEDNDED